MKRPVDVTDEWWSLVEMTDGERLALAVSDGGEPFAMLKAQDEELRARARLARAAPDLYRALASACMDCVYEGRPVPPEWDAALAKARGKGCTST